MGGMLFTTERIGKELYLDILRDAKEKITPYLGGRELHVPDSFQNKLDYGDIDFCLAEPLIPLDTLKEVFNITDEQIFVNTSVISIQYRNFQLDFCHYPVEDLESALKYMRMSDCSNMIGQMCNAAMGYRLTHRGLTYPIRLKAEDCLGEVVVSKDWKLIMEFLDLDYDAWAKGFISNLDLFHWLSQSKYFNKDFFGFEALNHQNRTRNRKRKTYSEFVEWLQDKTFPNNHPNEKGHANHLFKGLLFFKKTAGWWINKAESLIEARRQEEVARDTFNGSHVKEITGLTGSDLGKVLAAFKHFMTGIPLDRPEVLKTEWVKCLNQSNTLKISIKSMFENWYTYIYKNNV